MDQLTLERLGQMIDLQHADERERGMLVAEGNSLIERGWTLSEVVAYLALCEEVNPHLDEDHAIREMARIRAVVALRQGKK